MRERRYNKLKDVGIVRGNGGCKERACVCVLSTEKSKVKVWERGLWGVESLNDGGE